MDALFSYRDDDLYCHHSLDEAPDPEAFPIHAHETPEVFCFLSGHAGYLVEGTHYALAPGDILLMRPAETHKLVIFPDAPYERIAVHFSAGLFDTLDPRRALLRPFFDRPLGQRNRYAAADHPGLYETFQHFSVSPGLERAQIAARLLLLLTRLAGVFEAPAAPDLPASGFAAELVAYVNAHLYEEQLSIDRVCASFARSASQIGRAFREATGTSLWEYVTIKRLLAARAMLLRGGAAQEVSFAVGFSDYSAFYRAYKKRFGHAPSAGRSVERS